MISRNRQPAPKGSWRWAVRVAEVTAWGTAGLVSVLLVVLELDRSTFRAGIAVVLALGIWRALLFRVLVPRLGARRWVLPTSVLINLGFAALVYGLFRGEVAGVQLVFVPVIVATGLLGKLPEAFLAPTAGIVIYGLVSDVTGSLPAPGAFVLTGGVFLLSGGVAGLLARELRHHYRGEREEHRLATAVRHRLMAVVDAIDQAIIFSDRSGIVRVVTRRAASCDCSLLLRWTTTGFWSAGSTSTPTQPRQFGAPKRSSVSTRRRAGPRRAISEVFCRNPLRAFRA